MKIETLLSQAGTDWDTRTGAVSAPIYLSAVYQHPGLGQSTGYDYARTLSPTRDILETCMAKMEGGCNAYAFSSGMAAVDAVFRLFNPGDRIIISEDLYGGTFRLMDKVYKRYGLKAEFIDTTDKDALRIAFADKVAGVFVEVPTNPLLRVADLSYVSSLAKKSGAYFIVDNTFMTPLNLRPFEYGADIVVYSATKYLSGHNDLLAGIAIAKEPEIAEKIKFHQNSAGAVLAAFDSWLLLRSLKTLHLRMKKQEENAIALAEFLSQHPAIDKVYYPGLKADVSHELLQKQSKSFGAMISFRLKDSAKVPYILANIKVFLFAESLGGMESLITFPIKQTHADMDPNTLDRLGINDRFLRMSVGAEDINDLLVDIKSVLD